MKPPSPPFTWSGITASPTTQTHGQQLWVIKSLWKPVSFRKRGRQWVTTKALHTHSSTGPFSALPFNLPPQWLWDLAVVNLTEKQQKQRVRRRRETRKEENEKDRERDQERDQTETTSCQPAIIQNTFIWHLDDAHTPMGLKRRLLQGPYVSRRLQTVEHFKAQHTLYKDQDEPLPRDVVQHAWPNVYVSIIQIMNIWRDS